ncbi:MAG: 30S ribosomal protein S8 [Clostridia bacterium]|nr:30S ribosomal protein S8 [Clostridia bacterium]
MMTTDPIADMLTRIRNALTARHDSVEMPSSKMKKSIADILLAEGYINGVEVKEEGVQPTMVIRLKYGANRQKAITGIKRISKPGLRVYVPAEKLPKVLGGLGIAIVSTSKGVMTDKQARAAHAGGEVLAYVW